MARGPRCRPRRRWKSVPGSDAADRRGRTTRYDPNGRKVGDLVDVRPDDYGKIAVRGRIVSLSAQSIAIRRHDDLAGDVVVHFPRAGFLVTPAG